MQINTLDDFEAALKNGPYAWPGGYPLYWVMADGEAVQFKQAETENVELMRAAINGEHADKEWKPVALEINWEDDELTCAHTGCETNQHSHEPRHLRASPWPIQSRKGKRQPIRADCGRMARPGDRRGSCEC